MLPWQESIPYIPLSIFPIGFLAKHDHRCSPGFKEEMMQADELTERIIGVAIEVHRTFGPGLLESAYQNGMAIELQHAGFSFTQECAIDMNHRHQVLKGVGRADFVVARVVVVEIKSVAKITSLHAAQVATYLRLGGYQAGLLLNFNSLRMKDGIRRIRPWIVRRP